MKTLVGKGANRAVAKGRLLDKTIGDCPRSSMIGRSRSLPGFQRRNRARSRVITAKGPSRAHKSSRRLATVTFFIEQNLGCELADEISEYLSMWKFGSRSEGTRLTVD